MSSSPEQSVPKLWKVGDVIVDLYEVTGILGEGSMGKVYKVHHRSWNISLAVKSPKLKELQGPGSSRSFVRECETWVNLGLHPNTVSCYYVRNLGGIPRVFAEYVSGGSLKQWIEKGQLRDLATMLDVAIQIACGLHYAHEHGVIHQDVKPANVMMTPEGMAKVTDFGLAKTRSWASESTEVVPGDSMLVSKRGMTPAYCSPEQAGGKRLSRKTDIWSWGVSVLEMFVGKVTWMAGQLAAEELAVYLKTGPEDNTIPRMPESLAELLQQCFQSNPKYRPKSLQEIAQRLREIYYQITSAQYPREEPQAAALLADSLNNRALSYLDLGREDEAVGSWQEALRHDPQHLQTTLNLGYWEWQRGRIDDIGYLKRLANLQSTHEHNREYWHSIAQINLERGDQPAVTEAMSRAQALGLGSQLFPSRPKCESVKTFSGYKHGVKALAISSDNRYVLAGGSYQGRTGYPRLWEVGTGKCIKKFKEVKAVVKVVAFSNDGRFAALGGMKHLSYWDLKRFRCIRTFPEIEDVYALSISPDGSHLLFCGSKSGRDPFIWLWDTNSGKSRRVLKVRSWGSVSFSPDGHYVLLGREIWDLQTKKLVWKVPVLFEATSAKLSLGQRGVGAAAISPNGRLAIFGAETHLGYDYGAPIDVWDVCRKKQVSTPKGHNQSVTSVAISSDSKYALSSSEDGIMKLWDIGSGKCIRTFDCKTGLVKSIAFSPDGSLAVSGGYYPLVILWQIDYPEDFPRFHFLVCSPVATKQIEETEQAVRHLISKAEELMERDLWEEAHDVVRNAQKYRQFERSYELLDHIYRIGKRGRRIGFRQAWERRVLQGHASWVNCACFSPDGSLVLSGDDQGCIYLWDAKTGHRIRKFLKHKREIECVAFSPDGKYALSGSQDDDLGLVLWDVKTGAYRKFNYNWRAIYVQFSPDGRHALSLGREDRQIRLWRTDLGKCVRTYTGPTWLFCASFSPDGRYILSDWEKCALALLDVSTGKQLRLFKGHKRHNVYSVRSISFSPDGRLAVSTTGAEIILWKVESGKPLYKFPSSATLVCFTSDGRFVFSSGNDGDLGLWDVCTGKHLTKLAGHGHFVTAVSVSSDTRFVLTGSRDSTLRLWEYDWDYEFPSPANWDKGARPHLENFLTLHCAYGGDRISRTGVPTWTEDDFQKLLTELSYKGYGWLRPQGVRGELEKLRGERKYSSLEAITYFEKPLEIDPDHKKAHEAIQMSLKALEKGGRAQRGATPSAAMELIEKGISLGQLGQYEEALNCFDKAIEIDRRNIDAWYNKGISLMNLRRREEALSCFDRVIELDPRFALAWYNKGHLLAKLHKWRRLRESATCIRKALEIDPTLLRHKKAD